MDKYYKKGLKFERVFRQWIMWKTEKEIQWKINSWMNVWLLILRSIFLMRGTIMQWYQNMKTRRAMLPPLTWLGSINISLVFWYVKEYLLTFDLVETLDVHLYYLDFLFNLIDIVIFVMLNFFFATIYVHLDQLLLITGNISLDQQILIIWVKPSYHFLTSLFQCFYILK